MRKLWLICLLCLSAAAAFGENRRYRYRSYYPPSKSITYYSYGYAPRVVYGYRHYPRRHKAIVYYGPFVRFHSVQRYGRYRDRYWARPYRSFKRFPVSRGHVKVGRGHRYYR